MHRSARFIAAVTLVVVSGCGGSGISASNCDEVADETMTLLQRLIDDVDSEFGDHTVQEFIDTGGELPSVKQFEEDADKIDELAAELGCTQDEISAAVDERVSELIATTDLGRFLIDAIRSGGL